ncbi:hypothetical protein K3495_g9543 [Podosphaera aphanis]|nr:hypothetical protein K3495_g9543 [Podosphaera aphanis]
MIRNIIAANLIKYLRSNLIQPSVDLSNWKTIEQTQFDKVSEWVVGNTKTSNVIMYNYNSAPQAIISNFQSAAEMWDVLEQAYEGTGIVVQCQELMKFISLKYEDYNNLSNFIVSFNNTIQRLTQVMDNDD